MLSLNWQAPHCRLLFYTDIADDASLPVKPTPMPCNWDGKRMFERMRIASQVGELGDNVMLFDTDTIFRQNPFKLFNRSFDFAYTTRPVKNQASPVNGGVTAWRVNLRTARLMRFLINQAQYPTWPAYLDVRERLGRTDLGLDWWAHQDLLCALHDGQAPTPCVLCDAGPFYNWCPDSGGGRALTDEAKEQFFQGCTDPRVVIIHYKELKEHVQPGHFVLD